MLHSATSHSECPPLSQVLIPIHSFEPGGVERVALRLHQAWRTCGIRTHLVVGRAEGRLHDEISIPECDILHDGNFFAAAFETLAMIGKLPGRLRRIRPDLLFCPGNTYAIIGVAMKLILGPDCPPVILKVSNDLVRRDLPWPARVAYRAWLRLQGRLIDHFVAISGPMRFEIIDLMGVPDHRVDVIEDGSLSSAELDRIAAACLGAHRQRVAGRRLLAIGRLVKQKNFALLLRAFARACGPGDRLTIIGEGPERSKLERLAATLGISTRVKFPGHVNPVDPYLSNADTLVISSDYEGVPAALIEALAAGLPVIATNCCVSMPWLLDQGALGRLVSVEDEDELAGAMVSAVATDPMRARARARQFTVERAAEAYTNLMDRVAHRRPVNPERGAPCAVPAIVKSQ